MRYGRTNIQWDKSLFSQINAATQLEVDRINSLARTEFPREYENEWGCMTTLREKTDYLIKLRLADQKARRVT